MSNHQIDSDKLFAAIIRRIGKQLPSVLLEGMTADEIERFVLEGAATYCAKEYGYALNYHTLTKTDNLDLFWRKLDSHVRQHGAGSILLAIWRSYNHWSCVKKVTERSIILLDSMRLSRIHRTSIALKDDDNQRHLLCPQMTYLLSFRV